MKMKNVVNRMLIKGSIKEMGVIVCKKESEYIIIIYNWQWELTINLNSTREIYYKTELANSMPTIVILSNRIWFSSDRNMQNASIKKRMNAGIQVYEQIKLY